MSEDEITPSTPATVILSKLGWVRAASGNDVDAENMNYRSGDKFLSKSSGRTNEQACFITNLGRVYTVDIKDLPSARGQGEPLSSKTTMQPNERAVHVLVAHKDKYVLIASDKDYGFITKQTDLVSRMKNGRALITLEEDGLVMPPLEIYNKATDLPAVARRTGSALAIGADGIATMAIVPEGSSMVIHCGKRVINLSNAEILERIAQRAKRGDLLPRGFQKIDSLEVIIPKTEESETESAPAEEIEFTLE